MGAAGPLTINKVFFLGLLAVTAHAVFTAANGATAT